MNCAICEQPCLKQGGPEEEYQYQDTGEPVHTACRHRTFWRKGERVVTRFWEPGMPVGTVKEALVVFGPFQPVALSDEVVKKAVEWVTVEFDDGEVKDYAVWDLRKAPSEGRDDSTF